MSLSGQLYWKKTVPSSLSTSCSCSLCLQGNIAVDLIHTKMGTFYLASVSHYTHVSGNPTYRKPMELGLYSFLFWDERPVEIKISV